MNITFLDAYTINPGDLSLEAIEAFGHLTCYDRTEPDRVVERCQDADIVLVNKTALNEEHFARLPKLKLIGVAATGYDKIDTSAARKYGITVTNCAGYSSQPVSQMVLSLLLEAADSVGNYTLRNRNGDWCKSPDFCYTVQPRMELAGKKMAIVGFGNIGSTVARVMHALDVKLYAVSGKKPKDLPPYVQKITMKEAFSTCDIVSLHCPLHAANREFVNRELLAHARKGLILINTARGGLINETDVAVALYNNTLGAYCTDVLTQEPPTRNCPILHAPNTFITPHIAWNTREARMRIIAILADNIRGYLEGCPQNVVN